MDEQGFKKLLNEALKPVIDRLDDPQTGLVATSKRLDDPQTGLAAINRRLDDPETGLVAINKRLDDPQTGLVATSKRLDDPKTGLGRINEKVDALWEQTEKVTLGIEDVKEILNSHTTQFKRIATKIENISEDNGKLNKRLSVAENHLGIVPPPELTLIQ